MNLRADSDVVRMVLPAQGVAGMPIRATVVAEILNVGLGDVKFPTGVLLGEDVEVIALGREVVAGSDDRGRIRGERLQERNSGGMSRSRASCR